MNQDDFRFESCLGERPFSSRFDCAQYGRWANSEASMYVPRYFAETRLSELHHIIRENPLGMLVSHTAAGLDANHLPFELDASRGPFGTLQAHIARANPLWKDDASEVLIVFRGPHGYISPSWYPSKHETHRHVPTWNYEVVHAHGRLRVIDDESFVGSVVARLTHRYEAHEPRPWKMADAPKEYLREMLGMIVGIEIELTRLEGKRKLSQNREARDFQGAVDALRERGHDELAAAMTRGSAHDVAGESEDR
jgi:transcriptional regulator